ncbi:PEP-CTERM sorting domain-containing protein [Prosthecobacter sp. SYSU 5D2]|uniref:PEP-CTERM sorting domain-containing protein n=1 Tax=Prosthecobacter sp. SYSU 5D2 TaxID=3134134 RepID=UPI0031FE550F
MLAVPTGSFLRLVLLSGGLAWACLLGTARGIILYDTGDALVNTTAPAGMYADSGWSYQGMYGDFLGTMIAPQYFITADHIGVSAVPTFTSVESGSIYTIDAAANAGIGFWQVGDTDLRIYKINESFSAYAPLYMGELEAGMDLVVYGRGGPRGAEVELGGDLKGWYHTGADGVVRWGANEVDGITTISGNEYLRASFSPVLGQNEATLSVGDSGGAVFVNDGGVWKLAGINYGVDGFFDTNNVTGDGLEFEAALFDRGGFYQGSDGAGWAGPLPDGSAGSFYASRISASALEIQGIVGVPEPGGILLIMVGAGLGMRRRR